ncbi:four helix bundle protein [Faecalibacter sp. LW9]|uniref:four helix bundle protein n=1 Tax=Faecalibacter sp. LW9 TaxID=3103144 RepID=UPI002AFF4056|nr:four helix bundle protein [Faecalibacter sp. LW9]
MDIKSHKDLKVWQESITLVEDIYQLTAKFPKEELFGLTSQMRRASISISSNIAEGAGRKGKSEFTRFLYISLGSLSELDTQLEIAIRLKYIKDDKVVRERIYFIKNMISKLIISLNN